MTHQEAEEAHRTAKSKLHALTALHKSVSAAASMAETHGFALYESELRGMLAKIDVDGMHAKTEEVNAAEQLASVEAAARAGE